MKRIWAFLFVISIIISSYNTYSYAGEYIDHFYIEYDGQVYRYKSKTVTVVIDGIEIQHSDMPAIIISRRTLVPVREVFESEAFGAIVEWNGDKQEVYISYEDKYIVLGINKTTAYVNGEPIELDVPAKIIRDVSKQYGKTMIPIRFVSEQFGYEVGWEGDTNTAVLKSEDYINSNIEEEKEEDIEKEEIEEDVNDEKEEIEKDINDEEEKLDYLDSEKATKELPTPLSNNPIIWDTDKSIVEELKESIVENEIQSQNNPEVSVSTLEYIEDNVSKFIIGASGPISSVNTTTWNGKFIVDINNANWDMSGSKSFGDNPIVTSIRSSQFSQEPKITRFVFDLKNQGYKFNLSLSQDRKKLIVAAINNSIYNIQLGQNNIGDFITVTGIGAPNIEAFRLSEPNRIVFDLPNTTSLLGSKSVEEIEGQYVTEMRTAQFNDTTSRIVVNTEGQADYRISILNDTTTIIQLLEPTYNNIKYENYSEPTILLEKGDSSINLSGIKYEDNYLKREYTIILPGNYSSIFGSGDLKVNDEIIESINISLDNNGNTKLIIKEKSIHEFRIIEDDKNLAIKAYKPRQLYSQIIVVDAGHGGSDPGAIANGVKEKDLNLNITNYLKSYLDSNKDIKVYYTRKDDSFPSLQDRCDIANEVEADFFLSIHNNAYNASENGTETLYFPTRYDNALDSYELGSIVQQKLMAAINMKDRGLKSRGDLYVLRNTNMPAIIAEIGFLTNPGDVAKLKQSSFQRATAKALYESIVKVFDLYPTGR